MTRLAPTTSSTVGPFFGVGPTHPASPPSLGNVLVRPDTAGPRLRLEGRVLDGDGAPVSDAMVEVWQANAHGRYHHPLDRRDLPLDPAFAGFGRAATDDDGRFWFETVRPGRVPGPGGSLQAPHVVLTIFARGLLNHLVTRLYFADDPANDQDPVLARVPADRRAALLARPTPPTRPDDRPVYRLDLVLQGERETPFLNL